MQPKILSASRHQVECEVRADHPLRLSASKGRRVECTAGVLWITAYDHPGDVFLHVGESFLVPNGGLVLVEGIGCSRLRVTASASLLLAGSRLLGRGVQKLRRGWKPRVDAA